MPNKTSVMELKDLRELLDSETPPPFKIFKLAPWQRPSPNQWEEVSKLVDYGILKGLIWVSEWGSDDPALEDDVDTEEMYFDFNEFGDINFKEVDLKELTDIPVENISSTWVSPYELIEEPRYRSRKFPKKPE